MYVIGYRGNIPGFFILKVIEMNEELSVSNSLNALCYQSNCMNCFSLQNWRLYVW